MKPLTFFVYGVPRPKGSKRAFVVHTKAGQARAVVAESSGAALNDWLHALRRESQEVANGQPPFDGPVSLLLSFQMPRPKAHFRANGDIRPGVPAYHATRPDADKLVRAVKDALIGTLYVDDGQVCRLIVAKWYCAIGQAPGVAISISEAVAA